MLLANENSISSGGYTINNSLRFRASASAYLNRTFGTPTNNKIWTWSGWVKRGKLGVTQAIIGTTDNNASSGNVGALRFEAADTLQYFEYATGYTLQLNTTQVFRDPSAWYHIVVAVDTTQATASNRVKMYVNNTQITSFNTATYPSINQSLFINSATATYQAAYNNAGLGIQSPFDGYLAEVNFIDGQALTPSSFGSTNPLTGVWQPAKYTGTYGTNGFYLPFTNTSTTSTLVADASGNGNNWTPNNISLTAGVTYDSMLDSPTNSVTSLTQPVGNYAVGNAVYIPSTQTKSTVIDGNLRWGNNGTNAVVSMANTIAMTSGKYYWEVTIGAAINYSAVGIQTITETAWRGSGTVLYRSDGQKVIGGTASAYGSSYTTNDVIGFAYDATAGTLTCYKNNVSQGIIYSSGAGSSWFAAMHNDNAGAGVTYYHAYNFGQQSFVYTPPTGFQALCTTNLPDSTIVKGNKYMDATLYTGTSASQSVTNAGAFKPDLVWVKSRSAATDHKLTDSVRGVTKALISDTAGAETTDANGLTAFNSNGFTVGSDSVYNNGTGPATYVGWQWQAGQGTTSSNTSGSITSTVSVNATAGFSVVTYTGNGVAGATIGHGLGVSPKMIIVKNRSGAFDWPVYHASLTSNLYSVYLNTTLAQATTYNNWNSTSPTSSVFTVGSFNWVNVAANNFVAYCFAEIAGYSKFGSYTGNNSTDGPFVYTGFRPKFILIKDASAVGNWVMEDTSRSTYNQTAAALYPNLSNAEDTGNAIDILSNGFKVRASASAINQNASDTFIYMAFAESPFKVALAR